jgi:WD40 repeat protein
MEFNYRINGAVFRSTWTLSIDNSRICSYSDDHTIKVWNTNTGGCERTLEGHTSAVLHIILLFDGRLCSVSSQDSPSSADGNIKIWNVENGVVELDMHRSSSSKKLIQLRDGRLVVDGGGEVSIMGG